MNKICFGTHHMKTFAGECLEVDTCQLLVGLFELQFKQTSGLKNEWGHDC